MPSLVSGTVEKAAGDAVRLPMDWGDMPQLIDGAEVVDGALSMSVTIASFDIAASGLTVSGKQKDNGYTTSAKISGGTAGVTYSVVYSIVLDDADGTTYSRTAPLKVV